MRYSWETIDYKNGKSTKHHGLDENKVPGIGQIFITLKRKGAEDWIESAGFFSTVVWTGKTDLP